MSRLAGATMMMMGGADALAAVGGYLRKRGAVVSFSSAASADATQDVRQTRSVAASSGGDNGEDPNLFDVTRLPGITEPLGFWVGRPASERARTHTLGHASSPPLRPRC